MSRENFPVALRVLPRQIRADLLSCYRFARHVDDLGDEPLPAGVDREIALKVLAEDVRRLAHTGEAEIEQVRGLAPLLDRGAPATAFLDLVEANLLDQRQSRYATFDDLLGYCRLSADPVGLVVLHLFGAATPERVALSNRVCTGLQLVEHWQDLQEDHARGRVYLPAEDLERYGVPESALGAPSATPQLRALVAFETERALTWLAAGDELVDDLHGWSRLAVSAYVAGGRAAAARLRRAHYDPLATDTKPGGVDIAAAWLRGAVRRRR